MTQTPVPAAAADSAGGSEAAPSGTTPGGWEGLLPFIGAVGQLLADIARDERVPRRVKLIAGAAAAYVLLPLDLVPDLLPVVGSLDDALVAGWAVRRLIKVAGYDLVRELWTGSDDGFALLLFIAGVDR